MQWVGGHTLTVPDLHRCVTEGGTPEEAVASARDTIRECLKVPEKPGQPAPVRDVPPVYRQEPVIGP